MMGNKSLTEIHIYRGPSREDLFDALRLASEGRQVIFTFRDDYGHPVNLMVGITALELEDGSGKRFLFKCYTKKKNGTAQGSGYFDTEIRNGWIRI